MAAGEFLLKAIREEAVQCCFEPLFADCSIVRAMLGDDAGIIGSALLARDMKSVTVT
jgi:predicted NBD/HSP70 family sugar kinase